MTKPSNQPAPHTDRSVNSPSVTPKGIRRRGDSVGTEKRPRRSPRTRPSDDWYWIDDDDPSMVPWGYFVDDDL